MLLLWVVVGPVVFHFVLTEFFYLGADWYSTLCPQPTWNYKREQLNVPKHYARSLLLLLFTQCPSIQSSNRDYTGLIGGWIWAVARCAAKVQCHTVMVGKVRRFDMLVGTLNSDRPFQLEFKWLTLITFCLWRVLSSIEQVTMALPQVQGNVNANTRHETYTAFVRKRPSQYCRTHRREPSHPKQQLEEVNCPWGLKLEQSHVATTQLLRTKTPQVVDQWSLGTLGFWGSNVKFISAYLELRTPRAKDDRLRAAGKTKKQQNKKEKAVVQAFNLFASIKHFGKASPLGKFHCHCLVLSKIRLRDALAKHLGFSCL